MSEHKYIMLFLQKLFIYVLYQLQNISFVCSVYQTVLLAFQRYLAISKPMEYYASQSVTAPGLYSPYLSELILYYEKMYLGKCLSTTFFLLFMQVRAPIGKVH